MFLFQVTPLQYLSHNEAYYNTGSVDNTPYLFCRPWDDVTGMDHNYFTMKKMRKNLCACGNNSETLTQIPPAGSNQMATGFLL